LHKYTIGNVFLILFHWNAFIMDTTLAMHVYGDLSNIYNNVLNYINSIFHKLENICQSYFN
jgi:hypothetical protein